MTESPSLSPEQHDIYLHIMKHAPISQEATVNNCHVDGAVTEDHFVAYAELTGPPQGYATISLPNISNQIFILLADDHPERFCPLIAQLDAESESNDSLTNGHLSTMLGPTYQEMGWYGSAICSVTTSFDTFPIKSILNDDAFEFHQVVLLSKTEYLYAQREGLVALLKAFQERKRPLNLTTPDNNSTLLSTSQQKQSTTTSSGAQKRPEMQPTLTLTTLKKQEGDSAVQQPFKQTAPDEKSGERSTASAKKNTEDKRTESEEHKTHKDDQDSPSQISGKGEKGGKNGKSGKNGGKSAKRREHAKEKASEEADSLPDSLLDKLLYKGKSKVEKSGKKGDNIEHFGEIVIGCVLILAGLILAAILFQVDFPGASLFPLFFAAAGGFTLYHTFKDLDDKQR